MTFMSYSDRLHTTMHGGAQTYSLGDDHFPSTAPHILTRGHCAYGREPERRKLHDYDTGLRGAPRVYPAGAGKGAYFVSSIPDRRCRLVPVTPGFTAFTRTPTGAISIAAQRVR